MQYDLEQTTQLVTQLQQAHRLAVGFYQRILPLFDQIANQALEAEFWYWEPSETSRPCQARTRPSCSWAWDYLPLFASNHVYRNWDGNKALRGDQTLAFRLYIDNAFRQDSSLRSKSKGQPNPLQMDGDAVVEVSLFRCLQDSHQRFDELWHDLPWPTHQLDWQQSQECSLLEVCSQHVSLALLLADPESITQWIKTTSNR